MVGCQDKEAMTELEEFKAQAEVEEQNKELIRRLLKGLADKNIGIMDELFAEEFIGYYASSTGYGLEEFKDGTELAYSSLSDMVHIIDDLIAEDDKVGARFTLRGKYTGEFMGIPPTGGQIEYHSILLYRIADGKIQEAWANYDSLFGMIFQLGMGMELKPKEGEK